MAVVDSVECVAHVVESGRIGMFRRETIFDPYQNGIHRIRNLAAKRLIGLKIADRPSAAMQKMTPVCNAPCLKPIGRMTFRGGLSGVCTSNTLSTSCSGARNGLRLSRYRRRASSGSQ